MSPEVPTWVLEVRANHIRWIKAQLDENNRMLVATYQQACKNWIATNLHNRELGLPLTAKPPRPLLWKYADTVDEQKLPWVSIKAVEDDEPEPELPVLPIIASDNIEILGPEPFSTSWYRCGNNDRSVPNRVVRVPVDYQGGPTVPPGTYQKVGAPVGPGWWYKVA